MTAAVTHSHSEMNKAQKAMRKAVLGMLRTLHARKSRLHTVGSHSLLSDRYEGTLAAKSLQPAKFHSLRGSTQHTKVIGNNCRFLESLTYDR
jgi:hypothetical protein